MAPDLKSIIGRKIPSFCTRLDGLSAVTLTKADATDMIAPMRAESLDLLATMSVEDMRELYWELEQRLRAANTLDVSETPEGKAAITELLEARWQHYLEHPETAVPWEEVQQRLQKRVAEWKAARQPQ